MLRVVIVTIGLLIAFNGFVIWQWSGEPQRSRARSGRARSTSAASSISWQDVGTIIVTLGIVILLWLLFQFTKLGLALRAAAVNPEEARLVGVRVTWMLALGWGLAAVLGAVAGMLTAPSVGLDPQMMQPILIYAFAAAVLGGSTRRSAPSSAACARRLLNLIGVYVDFVGAELKLPGRAARDPRRAARAALRDLRPAGGETRLTPRQKQIVGLVSFAIFVGRRPRAAGLDRRLPRPAARLRRDLPHRAPRPQHPHRLHGPDLARPRRVHGHRRLHDRDPHGRERAVRAGGRPRHQRRDEGRLDDPDRRPRRRHRRACCSGCRRSGSPVSTSRSRPSRSPSRCRR